MAAVDRQAISDELTRVRATFRDLAEVMSNQELRRRTNGTRWTNQQMLFHMLFGYWLTRSLLVLVRLFAVLPRSVSQAFATVLNAASRGFHVVNYIAALPGTGLSPAWMVRRMDAITTALARSLAAENEAALAKGMPYPQRWDPFFKPFMTRADLYHYPTQHFDFHRRQLS
jgi:DinB superfamily